MAAQEETARVDSWIWSVRLVRTRSQATAACRAGHVHLNGERVKPAHAVRTGDEIRVRQAGHERTIVVTRVLSKRVSATVAGECFIDRSPPPAREGATAVGIR
ncbi:RNA-binding S4 domain-containing protein, partial [Candidatus Protofrankia californiensis]|uniref:RNA-binding S4 domain-containing protein n=1 Tax=Candidatus Protofrankia californiensis TaxID=1839754 RepID=UPI001041AD46